MEGRKTSKRLAAGTGGVIREIVATLNRAEFAGLKFGSMPAAFIPASVAGTKSHVIAGDLGLPLLARFRLILDYSTIACMRYPTQAPFPKDRLGLSLDKVDAGFAVGFVAPDSPAQAAGFKVGDKIAFINGKSADAWPGTSFADLRYDASGTNLAFTPHGGAVRNGKLADYF